MPWGHPSEHQDFEPQRHDDGCIEVIGFTMTSLVSLQLSSDAKHETATATTDVRRPRETTSKTVRAYQSIIEDKRAN